MMARDGRILLVSTLLLALAAVATFVLPWAFPDAPVGVRDVVAAARGPAAWGAAVGLALWLAVRALGRVLSRRDARRAIAITRPAEGVATVIVLAFLFIATGGSVGSALLSLGLVAFALTLALQRPILSLAGWASVRFGGLFQEGDRIEVNGMVGDVLQVGIFKTSLWEVGTPSSPLPAGGASAPLRLTARVVHVANAVFLEHPVANATGDVSTVFDEFVVSVAYEADWRFAETLLREVADECLDASAHAEAAHQ